MQKRKLILAGCAFASAWAHAHFSQDSWEFVDAHLVDSDLQTILDKHSLELEGIIKFCKKKPKTKCSTTVAVQEFPWLPGYFIKYGVDRLKNAESLRSFIDRKKLSLLMVPRKYYYHIKGRPLELKNTNYLIISEKVDLDKQRPLNKKQMRQLLMLIEQYGSIDNHAGNIICLKDGRVALVDTGGEGADAGWEWEGKLEASTDEKLFLTLVRFIGKDGDFIKKRLLDADAYELVVQKIHQLVQRQRFQQWYLDMLKKYVVDFTELLDAEQAQEGKRILRKYQLYI